MCPRHLLGHPIDPAEFMRVASNQDSKNIMPYLDSVYCSGCGVCEAFACPQGLSPRNLLGILKGTLRSNGLTVPPFEGVADAHSARELRELPLHRLISRLGLDKYYVSAPTIDDEVEVKEVKILTKQNVGAPAKPIVKVNDLVKVGDVIAVAQEGALCVNIHASIDGKVLDVNDRNITIRK